MLYYHGTTKDRAETILKSGILPNVDSYSLGGIFGGIHTEKGYVYLSSNLKLATFFADFRAKYDRAKIGEEVSNAVTLWKESGESKKSIPAIVTVELPDSEVNKLKLDERSGINSAFKHNGPIPASYIKGIKVLRYSATIANRGIVDGIMGDE